MRRVPFGLVILLISLSAVAQTGGGFNLEQNVIGDGGWRSDGGGFTVLGTMGQANAGSATANGQFHLLDGLWATENQTASSPFATVSGRVTTKRGLGVPLVLVTITNSQTNLKRLTLTDLRGEYHLAKIPTGANYLITANPFREFRPESIELFISQDRNDVDFVLDK